MTETNRLTIPQIADLALAVVFVAITQAEVWVYSLGDGYSIGTKVGASVFVAGASLAIAWRRSHPIPAFWVNAIGVVGTTAVGFPGDIYQWTNLIALYSVAAYGRGAQRWIALPAALGGVGYYFVTFPFEGDVPLAAFVATLWVAGWLAGRFYGARLEEVQLRQEIDLSRQLADANEQRLVLEEERVRIARELHDIIGHTVNVMVVHAGAGRGAIGRDNEKVRQTLDTIETTGRAALDELDRVLAVLRRDDVDSNLLPTPGLADLDALSHLFSDTGLAVDVNVSGSHQVPSSVQLALYRIVREALTNALRHGAATRAVVEVTIDSGALDLSVADDGHGDPNGVEAGRGISGMRERAAIHGGTVAIERADEGGILVRAGLTWEPRT